MKQAYGTAAKAVAFTSKPTTAEVRPRLLKVLNVTT